MSAPDDQSGPYGADMTAPASWRLQLRRLRTDGLARESTWSLTYEIAVLSSSLVSFMLLGRNLGAEGYGGYASLFAIISPLLTLAGSGLTLSLLQHTVQGGEPLASTARSCLSLALLVGLGLTVFAGAICLAVVPALPVIAVISLLCTEFLVMPAVHIAAATSQIASGFVAAARTRLIFVFIRTGIILGLALAGRLTIVSFAALTLAAGVVTALLTMRFVGRLHGFSLRPGRIRWTHLKSNAIYSSAISAQALGNDGDKLVMAGNGLVVELGRYSVAYRIVQYGMLPVASVVNAGHVRFLAHEPDRQRQHLDRAIRYGSISALYGIVCGLGLFIISPLVPVLFGEDFADSARMVRWLAPVVLVRSLTIFAGNGLMGLGRHGTRTTLIVVNAVIAMAIYIVLIPRFGWQGAAVGTLVAETIDCASGWVALVILQRRADRAPRLSPVDSVT